MSVLSRVFDRRVRGFRVVEIAAAACCAGLFFYVYLTKAEANESRNEIARLEKQIAQEHRKLRLLRAEVAHLEQPGRIEQLSEAHLGLGPVNVRKEARPEALVEIARAGAEPAP